MPRVVRERPPEFALGVREAPGLRQGDAEVVAGQRVDAGDGDGVAEERDPVPPDADLPEGEEGQRQDDAAAGRQRPRCVARGPRRRRSRAPQATMIASPTDGR